MFERSRAIFAATLAAVVVVVAAPSFFVGLLLDVPAGVPTLPPRRSVGDEKLPAAQVLLRAASSVIIEAGHFCQKWDQQ